MHNLCVWQQFFHFSLFTFHFFCIFASTNHRAVPDLFLQWTTDGSYVIVFTHFILFLFVDSDFIINFAGKY